MLGLLALILSSQGFCAEDAGTYRRADANGAANPWTGSLSGYYFALPRGQDYAVGIGAANRGALRVEARYNYENIGAGSVFAGWTLSAGERLSFQVTPMLGAVFGTTRGVAPGLEMSAQYARFDFYFEGEYVFDLRNGRDSFFYAWSELAGKPLNWLRTGLVAQRTSIEQSDRSLQLGGFIQFSLPLANLAVYLFNPGTRDWFAASGLELRF
jgi:hypothetical protein